MIRWKAVRVSWRSLLIGIGSVPLILGAGYLIPTRWGQPSAEELALKTERIYVSGDSVHTNILVPVSNAPFDWNQHFPLEEIGRDTAASYRYLSFGWGDRNFYLQTPTWAEFRLSNALKALFGFNNASAMHVQGLQALPSHPAIRVRCVCLDRAGYQRLMNFIAASFQRNQGQPIRIQNGHHISSSFYAAKGQYSLLRTCNAWTADGLRVANVNTPLWTAPAPAIFHHLPTDCPC